MYINIYVYLHTQKLNLDQFMNHKQQILLEIKFSNIESIKFLHQTSIIINFDIDDTNLKSEQFY